MALEDVDTAGDRVLFLLLVPDKPFLRIDDDLFLALVDLELLLLLACLEMPLYALSTVVKRRPSPTSGNGVFCKKSSR